MPTAKERLLASGLFGTQRPTQGTLGNIAGGFALGGVDAEGGQLGGFRGRGFNPNVNSVIPEHIRRGGNVLSVHGLNTTGPGGALNQNSFQSAFLDPNDPNLFRSLGNASLSDQAKVMIGQALGITNQLELNQLLQQGAGQAPVGVQGPVSQGGALQPAQSRIQAQTSSPQGGSQQQLQQQGSGSQQRLGFSVGPQDQGGQSNPLNTASSFTGPQGFGNFLQQLFGNQGQVQGPAFNPNSNITSSDPRFNQQQFLNQLFGQSQNNQNAINFGSQGLSQLAGGIGAGQIGFNDLQGPNVLRNLGPGGLLSQLLTGSNLSGLTAGQNLGGGFGAQFGTANPQVLQALGLGGDPSLGQLAQSQLFGLASGQFAPRGFDELQGATEGAFSNFGANQGGITGGIAQLLQQGSGGGQLGGELTSRLFGQLDQGGQGLDVTNPEVSQFIQQTLRDGGISKEFEEAFRRRHVEPAREQLLGDLAARGILDSDERLRQERELERDTLDSLLLQGREGAERAAGLGLQSSALNEQARGTEAGRIAQLLGLGGGLQGQFTDQLTSALGLGTAREGQSFQQGLQGFGGANDFSLGLIDRSLSQGRQDQDADFRNRDQILQALGLGLDQTRTGLGQLNANRDNMAQIAALQQAIFGDVRNFGGQQQNFAQSALMDFILGQMQGDIQKQLSKDNRSASNKALIGSGIGAAGGIVGALIM